MNSATEWIELQPRKHYYENYKYLAVENLG